MSIFDSVDYQLFLSLRTSTNLLSGTVPNIIWKGITKNKGKKKNAKLSPPATPPDAAKLVAAANVERDNALLALKREVEEVHLNTLRILIDLGIPVSSNMER